MFVTGFGYADLENNVRCGPETVMRVASISKAITMTLVAHLWEAGKLDLDAPIQKYIPDFPRKTFEGEEVSTADACVVNMYRIYNKLKCNYQASLRNNI